MESYWFSTNQCSLKIIGNCEIFIHWYVYIYISILDIWWGVLTYEGIQLPIRSIYTTRLQDGEVISVKSKTEDFYKWFWVNRMCWNYFNTVFKTLCILKNSMVFTGLKMCSLKGISIKIYNYPGASGKYSYKYMLECYLSVCVRL